MKASYVTETGDPDVISYGEIPDPVLAPTDILVRMEASEGVIADSYVRTGLYPTPQVYPQVIGRDLVGVVEEVGEGTTGFTVGDRVWSNSLGYGGRPGAWSERVAVPVERLYHLPENVSAEDAAVVLHGGATACIGLQRYADLKPGERVFVGGGAGGVGSAVVQVAVAMGAVVVATASPDDHEWVRSLGASEVFDYHGFEPSDLSEKVDLWWDTSGKMPLAPAFDALAPGERIVVTASDSEEETLPVQSLFFTNHTVYGFALPNEPVAVLAEAARVMNSLLAAGKLEGRVDQRLTIADGRKVHEKLEAGGLKGRILVLPS
ncbi:zinc-binding dehydrogenase [Corynebacterium doosanense]|uniref:Oxidoreductase n=1 Tax=Corynebacterium doosanense CAU 212 = DSM 45436 TaxID=558173 RepID=A0A097IHE3_9CORY|nr:zinc-binding dehydrogenase [Corynebacterium doosanense]AIT61551.1 oxidoreductase [Corynebacterium doosanense CAU 212 = DSM 45436]